MIWWSSRAKRADSGRTLCAQAAAERKKKERAERQAHEEAMREEQVMPPRCRVRTCAREGCEGAVRE